MKRRSDDFINAIRRAGNSIWVRPKVFRTFVTFIWVSRPFPTTQELTLLLGDAHWWYLNFSLSGGADQSVSQASSSLLPNKRPHYDLIAPKTNKPDATMSRRQILPPSLKSRSRTISQESPCPFGRVSKSSSASSPCRRNKNVNEFFIKKRKPSSNSPWMDQTTTTRWTARRQSNNKPWGSLFLNAAAVWQTRSRGQKRRNSV